MSLHDYRTLGRSGLAISPLALGAMTFGTARWGSGEEASRAIFNHYVDLGGNFVDTANVYSSGRSEEMVGAFIKDRQLRDDIVVATKAGFSTRKGPLTGGNGSKHLHRSVEQSLVRLRTDYIDLFWVHIWDSLTPAEELLETMTNLIRTGKIRHWGLSNAPAWLAAQIATLAAVRGMPKPVALQYFYSLANRDAEAEHVPLATEFGMGIVPWSPLAYGLLAGKYDRATVEAAGAIAARATREVGADDDRPEDDKRLDGANPFGDTLFTERNWAIVDTLRDIAGEIGETPARIALSWVVNRPGVAATLMGVSRIEQADDNIAALDLTLSADHLDRLNDVSRGEPRMLYNLFTPAMRSRAVFGGEQVRR